MQPWRISAGLTTALAGLVVLACGPRLEHLAPFWRLIPADYALAVVAHLALALAAVAATLYAVAAPDSPIWDAGSISWTAPSAAEKVIRNLRRPSGETPRARGTEQFVTNTQHAKSQDSRVRPKESPRIRRGSSSMARPLRSSPTRKRFLASPSRLRILMLARSS